MALQCKKYFLEIMATVSVVSAEYSLTKEGLELKNAMMPLIEWVSSRYNRYNKIYEEDKQKS